MRYISTLFSHFLKSFFKLSFNKALRLGFALLSLTILIFILPERSLASCAVKIGSTPTSICTGVAQNFSSSSTGTTVIPANAVYQWSFRATSSGTFTANPATASTSSFNTTFTLPNGQDTLTVYLRLRVTGALCITSDSVKFLISRRPTADFTMPSSACVDATVSAVALTAGSPTGTTIRWLRNNVVIQGNQSSISITNSVPGTYTYRLESIFQGCTTASADKILTVDPKPSTNFTMSSNNICSGNSVTLSATGDAQTSFTWSYLNTSNSQSGTIGSGASIVAPGSLFTIADGLGPDVTYQITCTATRLSCTSIATQTLTVKRQPAVNFDIPPILVCSGTPITFTNSSIAESGTTYSWNFGNPANSQNTSTQVNGTHTYTTFGAGGTTGYSVTLTATRNGCSRSVTKVVQIKRQPIIDFDETNNFRSCGIAAGASSSVRLINRTDQANNNEISSFTINWGDGSPLVSITPNEFATGSSKRLYTYTSIGKRTIVVTALGLNGCTSTFSAVYAYGALPNPAFQQVSIPSLCEPVEVSFNNNTSPAPTPGSKIKAVFGDGDSAEYDALLPIITHRYTKSTCLNNALKEHERFGNCQTSPSSQGFTARFSLISPECGVNPNLAFICDIQILASPQPNFTYLSKCPGDSVSFENTTIPSWCSQDNRTTYIWNWDDGSKTDTFINISPAVGVQQTLKHRFPTNRSTYNVKLTAKGQGTGACADKEITIPVNITIPPTANFSVQNICLFQSANITNTSISGTNAIDSIVYRVRNKTKNWKFKENNVTFVFPDTGRYYILQTVYDLLGCNTIKQDSFYINNLPRASFSVGQGACAESVLQFNNISTPGKANSPINQYLWDFGSGLTAALPSPTFTFNTGGIYPVRLRVSDINGCQDDTVINVRINKRPIADFLALPACESDSSEFRDQSQRTDADLISFFWYYNNTLISRRRNFKFKFPQAGTYAVKLVVFDGNFCKDSVTKDASVSSKPKAEFGSTTVCQGQATRFNNLSRIINPVATSLTYLWKFGYNNISSLQTNPTFTYPNAGFYNVTLIATDNFGCKDSIVNQVRVLPLPSTNFRADTVCQGLVTSFFEQIPNNESIILYQWNFDDLGNASTDENPIYSFSKPGVFNVSLRAVNTNNCEQTITKQVVVRTNPTANFTVSNACFGQSNTFTSTSVAGSGTIIKYSWNFGDGIGKSSKKDTIYRFSQPGNYNVTLVVEDNFGCQHTINRLVNINALPQPQFFTQPTCVENPVNFINNSIVSTGNVGARFIWNFGDGSPVVENSGAPQHKYAFAGKYLTTLTIIEIGGCTASYSDSVNILSSPIPIVNVGSICVNNQVQFSSQNSSLGSSSSASSYFWEFGDGTTSTLSNPVKTYTIADTFNLKLTITGNLGCTFTTNRKIRVNPSPQIDFQFNEVCIGLTTLFTNTSAQVNNMRWLWSFNDGSNRTSKSQNATHRFTGAGTFQVNLTGTDTVTGCSSIISKNVTVFPQPQAAFAAVNTCLGQPTQLTDLSLGLTASNNLYRWEFGDSRGFSIQQNPSYSYTDPGTYTIRLIVTNGNGCSDTAERTLTVFTPPQVNFNATSACVGNQTQFASIIVPAPGTIINEYLWNFGDGFTSNLANPTHLYASAGTYSVSLTITDNRGCRNIIARNVVVNNPSTPDFSFSNVCINKPVQIVNLSTSVGSVITNYFWDMGDGTTFNSFTPPPYRYKQPGTYNLTLRVTNNFGCIAVKSTFITVFPLPGPAFTASTACNLSGTSFTNISSGLTGTSNAYFWNFGDGLGTSTQNSPSYTYSLPGTYQVSLRVVNGNGCDSIATRSVLVRGNPVADFSTSQVCLGVQSNIIALPTVQSGTRIVSYEWDLGDGNSTTDSIALHVYRQIGTFNVRLIITDNRGCRDTISKGVVVSPLPQPSFTNNTACQGNRTFFTETSTISIGNIVSYEWDFGDLSPIVTTRNPEHTFTTPGTYNVSLKVTSDNGCSKVVVNPVNVRPSPIAVFGAADVCFGSPTQFQDLSFGTVGNINQWVWDFGSVMGGQRLSNVQNPAIVFPDTGTFPVSLIVINEFGCRDTTTGFAHVIPLPVVDFNFSTACVGNTIQFSNLSQPAGGANIVSQMWTFGDNTGSILSNPLKVFNTPGKYSVSLTVTDSKGCSKSKTSLVEVSSEPNVDFAYGVACAGSNISFINLSLPSDTSANSQLIGYAWNFGDGTTSTTVNPVKTYSSSGTFPVRLTVTNAKGCSKTITKDVQVQVLAVPNFTLNQACFGQQSTFTDVSITAPGANTVQSRWNFGDGSPEITGTTVSHLYPSPGSYLVTLTTIDNFGCARVISQQAKVRRLPLIGFSTNNNCFSDTTLFTSTSITADSSAPIAYFWQFGDGTTSNLPNPKHLYNTFGTFSVTLGITDTFGCRKDSTISVTIGTPPIVSFTNNTACEGKETKFISTSVPGSGNLVQYFWRFGDGNISNQANPSHTYLLAGTYNVTLRVVNSSGCIDSLTKPIEVLSLPIAQFDFDTACLGTETNFSSAASLPATFNRNIDFYSWDFGDGSTSVIANPSYRFSKSGVFRVTLTIGDNTGCFSSKQHFVYVRPLPKPDFNVSSSCLGNPTVFTNLSQAAQQTQIVFQQWDFGNSNSSNDPNPSYTYPIGGTYRVKLTVFDNKGCSDTTSKLIIIGKEPSPAFTFLSNPCLGDTLKILNSSRSSGSTISRYFWNFGNGDTSNAQNPTYLYKTPGTYTLTLRVFDISSCFKDTIVQVVIPPKPIALFGRNAACYGQTISFFDQSREQGGPPIIEWSWDMGDNLSLQSGRQVEYRYALPGKYAVKLQITDLNGCRSTYIDSIVVEPLPIAKFGFQTNCAFKPVQFTDSSTSKISIVDYNWDFGDGFSSQSSNPIHNYGRSGIYTVTLVVTNSLGCRDTAKQTLRINSPPLVNFNVTNTCFNDSTTFTNLTSGITSAIRSYRWSFDGLGTAVTRDAKFKFPNPSTYIISLTVTDSSDCDTTISRSILIRTLPTVDFTFNNACLGSLTNFQDLSTTQNGSIASRFWNFGITNADANATVANPSLIYPNPGVYQVNLTVTDTSGCPNIITKNVEVLPLPEASFISTIVCNGNQTQFFDLSTSANPASPIVLWSWDFGNGTSSALKNPFVIYAGPGVYKTKLLITDSKGCTDTLTKDVKVTSRPAANFIAANTCLGQPTTFNNLSFSNEGALSTYQWNFGDGNKSNQPNPTHTYSAFGRYRVSLISSDINGCSDTTVKTIEIYQPPLAEFGFSDVCSGDSYQFFDSSTTSHRIVSWQWSFGLANAGSNLQNPIFTYGAAATYSVSLTITDSTGCTSVKTRQVNVKPRSFVNFSADPVCFGQTTVFNNQSSFGGGIISWLWKFGDGRTSNLANPVLRYLTSDTFSVTLIARNSIGCLDSITKKVIIKDKPNANFTFRDNCLGNATAFTNISNSVTSPITNYLWSFGDGNTSTIQNPIHTFSQAGAYLVRLIVINQNNCSDTTEKLININRAPRANFTATKNCFKEPTQFVSFSQSLGGVITEHRWNFGEGGTSLLKNPSYVFRNPGVYVVTLTVLDENGCADRLSKVVIVDTLPSVDFNVSNLCIGTNAIFTNLSKGRSSNIITYKWDFGDGVYSNLKDVTHNYQLPGTYRVRLKATDISGCVDSIEKLIQIKQRPFANFSYSETCQGSPTTFSNLSSGLGSPITRYLWIFTDGDTSTLANPIHTFRFPGKFQVQLLVFNQEGCSDTFSREVLIKPAVIADYRFNRNCIGKPSSFVDLSSAANSSIARWSWNFGDGDTSSARNPQHIYSAAGRYNVQLIAISELGCSDTISRIVIIDSLPKVLFTNNNACVGGITTFNNITAVTSGFIVQWLWNFGDSTSSRLQNPQHTYATSDTFKVRLTALDNLGCEAYYEKWVIVNPLPQANFISDPACVNLLSTFTDISTPTDAPIVNRIWDFGNGQQRSGAIVQYRYLSAGTFTVKLTVTDANGCSHSLSRVITVRPQPIAFFTASTVCMKQATEFTDASSGETNNEVIAWIWNFGDGKTSNTKSPSHFYDTSGTFTATLIVTNRLGCSDTFTRAITVLPLPVIQAKITKTCIGDSTSFINESFALGTGNQLISYIWDFGDGSPFSFAISPKHIYFFADTFDVKLIGTDAKGCTNSKIFKVIIAPEPNSRFNYLAACVGKPTQFIDSSISYRGTVTKYLWSFGDGNFSSAQNPTHIYAIPGNYTVSLTIEDSNGCSNLSNQEITILPQPIAAFSSTTVCQGKATLFTDQSSSLTNIISWNWNFGEDNKTSTLKNPSHLYKDAGVYTVILIIINSSGCIDTVSKKVTVYPLPEAEFRYRSVCLKDSVQFIDESKTAFSSSGIVSRLWDFGDGSTNSTQTNPKHLFLSASTYQVRLTVTDSLGCVNSILKQVIVNPLPAANFYFIGNCVDNDITFIDSSIAFNSTIKAWFWDFGQGNFSSLQNPLFKFLTPGSYPVRLTVTDTNGCQNTTLKQVSLGSKPIAAFNATTTCAGRPVLFNNVTTQGSQPIARYEWIFGLGNNTSNTVNPSFTYRQPGRYRVVLKVFDITGCFDSASQFVNILNTAAVNFNAPETCLNSPSVFTNLTSLPFGTRGIESWNWDFGDNAGTSTLKDPQYRYNRSGTYTVTLVATDSAGCISIISKPIKVAPLPIANFVFETNCVGYPSKFTDSSTTQNRGIIGYQWFVNGAFAGTTPSLFYSFNSPGTYRVSLNVIDSLGCTNTIEKQVSIDSLPKANFSFTTACFKTQTVFSNQSFSFGTVLVDYKWYANDRLFSSEINPRFLFANSGFSKVKLVVTNLFGCVDSISKLVYVKPLPTAEFDATSPCLGTQVQFTDRSLPVAPITPIAIRQWNFGDGTPNFFGNNPTKLYTAAGTYTVTLTITDVEGCVSAITKQVRVRKLPRVNFDTRDLCSNKRVQFIDSSLQGSSRIVLWSWDFGDFVGNSVLQNPSYQYQNPGVFNVTLRVTDSSGCTSSIRKIITVNAKPIADFRFNRVCAPGPITFTNNTTGPVGDLAAQYFWNFGDGATSTLQNPIHTYQSPGTYNVSLKVISMAGCMDSVEKTINYFNKPTADFDIISNCAGKTVSFIDRSLADNALLVSYRWDFSNGRSFFVKSPSIVFDTAKNYTVRLIVIDARGCRDTTSKSFTIREAPKALFSYQGVACVQEAVVFRNESTFNTQDTVTYIWDFGDGFSSNQANPNHIYNLGGKYRVKLRVIGKYGCTDTTSLLLSINQMPIANFSKTIDSSCGPVYIGFNSLTNGNANFFEWNFGNGETASGNSYKLIKFNPGKLGDTSYVVTLSAGNECGVTTKSDTVKVFPQPIAYFSLSADSACSPFKLKIKNLSAGKANLFRWTLNDTLDFSRTNDLDSLIFFTKSDTVTHTIRLIAQNNCGIDTIVKKFTILPRLVEAFMAIDTSFGCAPLRVKFSDFSSGGTSVRYEFGDGGVENNTTSPLYTYRQPGNFRAMQIVTDGCGTDTSMFIIEVFPRALVDFSMLNDTVCVGVNSTFTASGQSAGSFSWSISGDTTIYLGNTLTTAFTQPGTYTVKLTGKSSGLGCDGDTTKTITVVPGLLADIRTPKNIVCQNEFVSFIDSTKGAGLLTYFIDYGDGNSSVNALNLPYKFRRSGFIQVKVRVLSTTGCVSEDSLNFLVNPAPAPKLFVSSRQSCTHPVTVRIENQTIDTTEASQLFINGNRILNGRAFNYTFTDTGQYNVVLINTNRFGCIDSVGNSFTVFPSPDIKFSLDTFAGCIPFTLKVKDSSRFVSAYRWDFGEGSFKAGKDPLHTYQRPGRYNVTLYALGKGGCRDTLTLQKDVIVYDKPFAEFTHLTITDPVPNGRVVFENRSNRAVSYQWDFGDGLFSDSISPTHIYKLDGTYNVRLYAYNANGCIDTIIREVYVPYFKGLFVPNSIIIGDPSPEVNIFSPQARGLIEYSLRIFDKWGNMIFETNDLLDGIPTTGWDGKFRGEYVPQGTYLWRIDAVFKDGNRWQGVKRNGSYENVGTLDVMKR